MNAATRLAARAAVVGGLCLVGLGADCGRGQEPTGKGEDLTITVEADRSKLSQEERELRARLEAFEAERMKLREERATLMSAKDELKDKDESSAKRLRDLEQRLWERERSMWAKESSLEKERETLAEAKNQILERVPGAAKAGGGAGGDGKAVEAQLRSLEERKRALDAREKALADREALLNGKVDECALAVLRLSQGARPVVVNRPAPGDGPVGRAEAERAVAAARAGMQKKGLRWDDLPSEVAGLQAELAAASKAREWPRLKELAAQLDAVVVATLVDSGFIDRKFVRLNQAIKAKPAADKKAVSSLLRKATQLVGDGQYLAANLELNKIFALLR
ncbi:MAG TPA: hypothetical protein PK668_06095 [Myxococcota bacterium]|nr:hypothetical protein [Myxococcota bacterium]HRY92587.1 hypothetical protein [Myxococcota bacterium]